MKRFTTAFIIALLYLVLGNVMAANESLDSPLIEIIFAPYTFIGGMSAFAGWDWLSFVLEGIIFVITIPFFYSLLIAIRYVINRVKERRLQ